MALFLFPLISFLFELLNTHVVFFWKNTNWIQVPETHHHTINQMKRWIFDLAGITDYLIAGPLLSSLLHYKLHVLSVSFNYQPYLEFEVLVLQYKYIFFEAVSLGLQNLQYSVRLLSLIF
jgi:hypothetical protein